jgi:hypothetical protein
MMAGEGGSLAPQNDETFAALNLRGLDVKWTSFEEYFRVLESKGIALNVVHNVGASRCAASFSATRTSPRPHHSSKR